MINIFELYTDYLQVSLGLATATNLSKIVDNKVTHDQVTRMLANLECNNKFYQHQQQHLEISLSYHAYAPLFVLIALLDLDDYHDSYLYPSYLIKSANALQFHHLLNAYQ